MTEDRIQYKSYIFMRTDLGMGKGKMCGQAAHACTKMIFTELKYDKDKLTKWYKNYQPKIVIKVSNKEELESIFEHLTSIYKVDCYDIKDCGKTQIEPDTLTCFATEPVDIESIVVKEYISKFKLL